MDDARELFFAVARDDVRGAAEVLRPAHGRSGGSDGFISFECTPDLADDAEATIDQAVTLWRRLDLPNVMIKVPATIAGVTAIEELTVRGVNVNVTLLFSVERYEAVIEAYLAGLERRLAAGRSVAGIRSVASFFVSRIDVEADAVLGRTPPSAAAWRSPTYSRPMGASSPASPASAGRRCAGPAQRRSAPCGRARRRRTPAPPTSSRWRGSSPRA